MPTPILIISDAPDSGTGLGRITKDLAYLLSTMPEFRVGTFGRGGIGSRHLPYAQYTFDETQQWGEGLLIKACEDFSRDDDFIIFTIWDASRLFWFGAPQHLPETPIKDFLLSGKFKRWGYFPVDGNGPWDRLSILSEETINGYDRILAYSQFGKRVLRCGDFIPHGIDDTIFYPREHEEGREILGIDHEAKLVGCVMTNQARKDWGLWAQIARQLISLDQGYKFWVHTDLLERYWSLPALIADFELSDHVKITQSLTDDAMAKLYSACDVTMLPSLGEGFGYPIAESLACGVPVVHHDYAAGHEIMPETILGKLGVIRTGVSEGLEYRLDTLHNIYRPVLYPDDWVEKITDFMSGQWSWKTLHEESRAAVEHLFWRNLGPVWKNWFRAGLG